MYIASAEKNNFYSGVLCVRILRIITLLHNAVFMVLPLSQYHVSCERWQTIGFLNFCTPIQYLIYLYDNTHICYV